MVRRISSRTSSNGWNFFGCSVASAASVADGATTADCLALMTEARRRALEQFGVELEREVVFLGALELPALT